MDDTTEHHYPEYPDDSDVFPIDIEQIIDGTKETMDDDPILINYIKHHFHLQRSSYLTYQDQSIQTRYFWYFK